MKKQIKKFGNSLVIRLDKGDLSFYGLKENDWIFIKQIVKIFPYEQSSKKMLKEIKDEIDPIGARKRTLK